MCVGVHLEPLGGVCYGLFQHVIDSPALQYFSSVGLLLCERENKDRCAASLVLRWRKVLKLVE